MEDNEVRSEEDGISKQAHVKLVNKEPRDFWFHQVLRCFGVVWSQFWTSSKCLLALETTTNNQEVNEVYTSCKIWIIYPKIIFACAWPAELFSFISLTCRVVQLYQSCYTPTIQLFEFVNISDHSRLINSNLLQRSKISVLEDNEVRNEEDSTS